MNHMLTPYALVILRKDNKIALLQRAATASFAPGDYCLVGGAVEKHETFRVALVREVYEEVGVIIQPQDLHFVHVFYRTNKIQEIVACVFVCDLWQGEPYNKEPEKHTDLAWFALDELPAKMIPAHRGALALIAQGISYSEQEPG